MKLGIITLAAVCSLGCPREPKTAVEQAHAYLAAMGYGAQAAVDTCAIAARAMRDAGNKEWEHLATECADGYDVAKTALLSVESALDTWEEVDAGKVACAAGTALFGIERISRAMSAHGVVPNSETKTRVEYASRIAGWLLKTYGGECAVKP